MSKKAMMQAEGQGWAGMVLDHQHDLGGAEFQKMAQWWHPGLRPPAIGFTKEAGTFAAHVKIAELGQEYDLYPLDTPEDAYASALYFYRWGLPSIGSLNKEAAQRIEGSILDALLVYGLEFDKENYKRACYEALLPEIERQHEEVWAGAGLPTTTPAQTAQSCAVFTQYEDRYKADERIKIACKLKTAALYHGISWDHDLAGVAASVAAGEHVKTASSCEWALSKREEVVRERGHALADYYCSEIERIKVASQLVTDYEGILKLAQELEEADLMVDMQGIWGDGVPDPARTMVTKIVTPHGWLKQAQERGAAPRERGPDWSKLNFDKLAADGLFSDDLVERLRDSASEIIPRLDVSYQSMLAPYLK